MPTNTELIHQAVAQNTALDKQVALIQLQLDTLQKEISRIDTISLSERIKVLESQVGQLNSNKEDSYRRLWQFLILLAGAALAFTSQLIVAWVKK